MSNSKLITLLSVLCTLFFVGSCTENSPTLYQVSVTQQPAGVATISPSPDSSYEAGTEITLRALPSESHNFVSWTGDDTTDSNPYTFTVNENKSLIANFEIKTYQLTIGTKGEGAVTEKVIAADSTYDHGTRVELTAEPNTGWEFIEWQGDITGSENTTQITVDEPKSVTAVFEKKTFTLSVNTDGQGEVVKDPDKESYEYEEAVELTAKPANGWAFARWGGDLEGSANPKILTIDEDKSVEIIFNEVNPELQLWRCDSFFGCDSSISPPERVGLPYTVNSTRYVSTTSSFLTHARFFLRAVGGEFTIVNVSAKDKNNLIGASFDGIQSGTVVSPGTDIEFALVSGKTGGAQANLEYKFDVKDENSSFVYSILLQSN